MVSDGFAIIYSVSFFESPIVLHDLVQSTIYGWSLLVYLHEQTVLKIHHTYIYVYIILYQSIYIFTVYPFF